MCSATFAMAQDAHQQSHPLMEGGAQAVAAPGKAEPLHHPQAATRRTSSDQPPPRGTVLPSNPRGAAPCEHEPLRAVPPLPSGCQEGRLSKAGAWGLGKQAKPRASAEVSAPLRAPPPPPHPVSSFPSPRPTRLPIFPSSHPFSCDFVQYYQG